MKAKHPIQKLLNCSFLAAACVVLNHSYVAGVGADCSVDFAVRLFSRGLCRWAVPYFFVVAGYFLSKHCLLDEWWWQKAVKKRLRTLMIPFIIWNVMALILNRHFSLSQIISGMGLNPAEYPEINSLWFIRSLMILVVISPLIKFVIRKTAGIVLPALYILMLVFASRHIVFKITFSLEGLFYFSAGMWIGLTSGFKNITSLEKGLIIVLGILAGVGVCLLPEQWVPCAIPFLVMGIYYSVSESTWPCLLTDYSFAIYVIHGLIFGCMRSLGISFSSGGISGGFLRCLTCLTLCIVFSWVFRRLASRLYGVCFGGR